MVNVPLYTIYVAAVEYFQSQISKYVAYDNVDVINLNEKCNHAASILEPYKPVFERQYNVQQLTTISENPLYLYIAAEYFLTQIKDIDSPTNKDEINSKWDVNTKSFSLFEHFLDIKFRKIRFEEKKKIDLDNPDNEMMFQNERQYFIEKHKRMALCALFEDKDLLNSHIISEVELKDIHNIIDRIDAGEEKTGVVEKVIENIPRFVHLVFAEYFAIEYICDKLKFAFSTEMQTEVIAELQKAIWNFVMNIVLYKSAGGVRTFFDRKLKDIDFQQAINCEESKKIVFEALLKQGRDNTIIPEGFSFELVKTSLNIAVEESLFNIQDYFVHCVKQCVNDENLDEYRRIIADGLVVLSAFGMNNDAFLFKIKESLVNVKSKPINLVNFVLAKFIRDILPIEITTPENIPADLSRISCIPPIVFSALNNISNLSSLRTILLDYLKLFWDLSSE